jgi:peptidoglycan/xylan/chitin deacetylase (PgdA/CDA1 family)
VKKLLVLSYHAIQDQSGDRVLAPYGVPPGLFAEHLDYLSSTGFSFVGPDALATFLAGGDLPTKRTVLLTFDDGYEDLLAVAHDILRPRKIQAVAFAVTRMKSGTNEWDQAYGAAPMRLLTTDQLRELASLGVEIGSHSRTHREMPLLDPLEQEQEACGSADDLVAQGLPRPRFFAYPFGAADTASRAAVRKGGYVAAFGGRTAYMTRPGDTFDLPRVVLLASDRDWRFRFKMSAPRVYLKLASLQRAARARMIGCGAA